jgi:hypothetical protein
LRTTMLLCDYAEAINGKLYVMGGGWSLCTPGPRNLFVAVKILVPWDSTNEKHEFVLMLQDESGNIIQLGEPSREVKHEGVFEVGRPPNIRKGSDIDFVIALGFIGLPLDENKYFRLQLEIDGEPCGDVSFSTTMQTP